MTSEDQPQVIVVPEEENLQPPPQHKNSPWATMLALAALAVSGGVATFMYLDRDQVMKTQENISQQSAVIEKIRSTQQLITSSMKEQSERLATLGDNFEQLKSLVHQDQESWILSEVDYLVRLANYNVQYVGDGVVAKKLLEAADQRIQTLANPKLSEVRATITNNIMQLGGNNSVDVEKLLERLNQLSASVVELHIVSKATLPADSAASATKSSQNAEQDWKEKLKSSLDTLHTVVTVRHSSELPKPLVTPEQHANLIENIQLKLSIAQWAVLHHKQKLYQSSIEQAKTWLSTHFRKDDLSAAVINGLTELEQAKVVPNLPDLGPTVIAVHEVLQEFAHNRQPTANHLMAPAPVAPPVAPKQKSEAPNHHEAPAKDEAPNHHEAPAKGEAPDHHEAPSKDEAPNRPEVLSS